MSGKHDYSEIPINGLYSDIGEFIECLRVFKESKGLKHEISVQIHLYRKYGS